MEFTKKLSWKVIITIEKLKKMRFLTRKKMLWLFLICVFPIHFWAILIFLNNLSWLLESGLWFVLGVFSYQLLLAFLEAFLMFVFLVLLSPWLPRIWTEDIKIMFLGNLAWVAWMGLIFFQSISPNSMNFLTTIFIAVGITGAIIIAIQYFSLRNTSIAKVNIDIFDRIQILAYLFLGFDVLGFLFILIRNLFWIK